MFATRVMSSRLVIGSALLLTGGAIGFRLAHSPQLGAAEVTRPARDSARPDTKEPKIKGLLKERLATLHELVKAATAEYHAGRVSFDRLQQATRAVLDAELERCESDKERIKVLEKIVALAKESEKHAVQRYKTGAATQSDALLATAARLEAEIALEREKAKAPGQAK